MQAIPDAPGYFVTEDGRVFSMHVPHNAKRPRKAPRELRTFDSSGYAALKLSIGGKVQKRYVHELVLTTFVGPRPEGMECRHLDGDRRNNHLANLEWGTRSENQMDRVQHGTHHRGERHGRSKYDRETVRKVRRMIRQKSRREVAEEMGIPYPTVCSMTNGSTWGWLDG